VQYGGVWSKLFDLGTLRVRFLRRSTNEGPSHHILNLARACVPRKKKLFLGYTYHENQNKDIPCPDPLYRYRVLVPVEAKTTGTVRLG
jgi:hypothetical protein